MDVMIDAMTEAGGVRVLTLRAMDGAALPAYLAGAHIDVTLGNGQVRQYSLCCADPDGSAYRIAVKRETASRGGSHWLHDVAAVGTILRIGQPRNAFALAPVAGMHLLFAGGIGVTPILSMAYALLRRAQPFHLDYFVRDAASATFAAELDAGPLAPFVTIHAGVAPEDIDDRIGVAMAAAATADTHVYVCGPAPFMHAVTAQATQRFGAAAVHQESFGAGPKEAGAASGETSFVLQLQRSGREITVPAGRTALACLQEAGLAPDCSCEVGVCGTCRTTVLGGIPQHLDSVLSEAERQANNSFMPCVSRALTPALVLDL